MFYCCDCNRNLTLPQASGGLTNGPTAADQLELMCHCAVHNGADVIHQFVITNVHRAYVDWCYGPV